MRGIAGSFAQGIENAAKRGLGLGPIQRIPLPRPNLKGGAKGADALPQPRRRRLAFTKGAKDAPRDDTESRPKPVGIDRVFGPSRRHETRQALSPSALFPPRSYPVPQEHDRDSYDCLPIRAEPARMSTPLPQHGRPAMALSVNAVPALRSPKTAKMVPRLFWLATPGERRSLARPHDQRSAESGGGLFQPRPCRSPVLRWLQERLRDCSGHSPSSAAFAPVSTPTARCGRRRPAFLQEPCSGFASSYG